MQMQRSALTGRTSRLQVQAVARPTSGLRPRSVLGQSPKAAAGVAVTEKVFAKNAVSVRSSMQLEALLRLAGPCDLNPSFPSV